MKGHDFFNHDSSILFDSIWMEVGEEVPVHEHDYPHDCFVLEGTVVFNIGPIAKTLVGPDTIHFPGGAWHGFKAYTKALVICTHPADKVPNNRMKS
jgi:quercetin dioxygenase-like cupin family protein